MPLAGKFTPVCLIEFTVLKLVANFGPRFIICIIFINGYEVRIKITLIAIDHVFIDLLLNMTKQILVGFLLVNNDLLQAVMHELIFGHLLFQFANFLGKGSILLNETPHFLA